MRHPVLVVEHDHDLRSAIVAALTRENIECDAVFSGEAALIRLRDHRYAMIVADEDDAMLLDDFASTLVLLTEFERADNIPFLRKPFDSRQLLARLRLRI